MRKGEIINGYTILRDFSTAGGGLSKWTFAEKKGEEFFIKEFLAPTYPVEGGPGSPKTKALKREKCNTFEKHQRSLITAVSSKCAKGGNVIFSRDFFRHGAKYYKVTEKIDVASLEVEDIAKLPLKSRILIMKTVAHSLRVLHKLDIVHGDLKPNNILIKETRLDYTAKLIDFDNSFFSGKPPEKADDLVGDLVFYSPELATYVKGDGAVSGSDLQLKSDIFALGIVYCLYLTGDLPAFDLSKYQYPCIAANHGQLLTIKDEGLPPKLVAIINSMLQARFEERPTTDEVFNSLATIDRPDVAKSPMPAHGHVTSYDAPDVSTGGSKLKGKLAKRDSATGSAPAVESVAEEVESPASGRPAGGGLRGKGLRLIKKDS